MAKTQKQLIEKGIKTYRASIKKYALNSLENCKKDNRYCRTKRLKAKIQYHPDDVEYYNNLIKRNKEKVKELKKFLKNIIPLKSIQKDIKMLKKHPFLIGIEYTPSSTAHFSFYTKQLTIKFERKKYKIGNYKISINSKDLPNVVISNLQGTVPGRRINLDHWCVQNTNPCFEQWEHGIKKYIREGQLYLAVDTIIKFLISTKSSDGADYVEEWLTTFNNL